MTSTPLALQRTLRRRWLIWAVLGVDNAMVNFQRVAPAVMASDLMAAFQTSGTVLGALAATYYYIYAAMQVPTGVLGDSLGPRPVATLGLFTSAAGSFLFALAPSLWVAFAGRFLTGFGLAVVFTSSMRVFAEWFRPHEFVTVTGLTMTVASFGGILAATPLSVLLSAIGWRASLALLGILSIGLGIVTWLLVRDRPEQLGLPGVRTEAPLAAGRRLSVWQGLRIVLRNRYTWPAFFAFFGYFGSLFTFLGLWGIPYLVQVYGISRTHASGYLILVNVGLIIGGPLQGLIADRWLRRRKPPYFLSAAALTAIWAIFCFVNGGKPPLAWMGLLSFLFGLTTSASIITHTMTTEVNPRQFAGIAIGVGNTAGFIGGAVLQVIMGMVLDRGWQGTLVEGVRIYPLEAYQAAFFLPLGAMLFSTVMALFTKETRCRNIYAELYPDPAPRAAAAGSS
ncbi:MAG: MFS transporter [Candidatus Tectomicrobia bacterium]|nr:MFS transporter [Candidatus Tectomicrobia bacterium]